MADTSALLLTAKSERLLLDTYKIKLADFDQLEEAILPGTEDPNSVAVLKLFHPAKLEEFTPRTVYGDGNCLYRAISLALYGSQDHHLQLRLLTALEICLHSDYYQQDPIGDNRIVTGSFTDVMKDVCKIGAWADFMHITAVSAVVGLPFKSYYPPMAYSDFTSEPLTRMVVGREVKTSASPACTIMWTQLTKPKLSRDFQANHFVPIFHKPPTDIPLCIDIDESADEVTSDIDLPVDTDPGSLEECEASLAESALSDNSSLEESTTPENREPLPGACHLQGFFMDCVASFKTLTGSESSQCIVPNGLKENVFFIVDNSNNVERRGGGKRSLFVDDCGVWGKGSTKKHSYWFQNGSLSYVEQKTGVYVKSVKNQRVPLDPQPPNDEILIMHRFYVTLKRQPTYKKRISWIEQFPAGVQPEQPHLAIYEYIGNFPDTPSIHSNMKNASTEYVRTQPAVIEQARKKLKTEAPRAVYEHMVLDGSPSAPRDLRQVQNIKYKLTRADQLT